MEEMAENFSKEKIIAVLRAPSFEEAKEKALAIFDGGIRLIEVTFTVPKAELLIDELRKELVEKGATIGAGTVLDKESCKSAIESGAQFIVSPHLSEEISALCKSKGIFYMPGAITPTEIVEAFKLGHKIIKLFPGEVLGTAFVKSMKGPFPSIRFVPTGGVNLENICEWFKAGVLAVGIGTSLTNGTVDEVREKAKAFVKKVQQC